MEADYPLSGMTAPELICSSLGPLIRLSLGFIIRVKADLKDISSAYPLIFWTAYPHICSSLGPFSTNLLILKGYLLLF